MYSFPIIRIILCFCIILISCAPTIKRWPIDTEELKSQKISYKSKNDIFENYLWTYPSIASQKLEFKNNKASILFKGKVYSFEKDHTNGMLLYDGKSISFTAEKNKYYDINKLKLIPVQKQRWVSKTVYVYKSVQEMRTVPVHKSRTVPVTTFSNGMSHTSYRTEYYTDYETKFVTVSKYVPETKWEWQYYTEYHLNIPDVECSEFALDGHSVTLYRIEDNKKYSFYFQNTTFLELVDTVNVFHSEKGVHTLIIDANSDGYYFDNSDKIMFNTWNPYDKKSKYRSISNFMHNNWQPIGMVCSDLSVCMTLIEDKGIVDINNENSEYVGLENTGEFILNNIPNDTKIFLNGERYLSIRGNLEREIEYGKYNLHIQTDGFLDYKTELEINSKNPIISMPFPELEKGGKLSIENIYDKDWFLILKDEKGYEEFHSMRKELFLTEGNYVVTIHNKGFEIKKNIKIQNDNDAIINYQNEVDKLAENNKKSDK